MVRHYPGIFLFPIVLAACSKGEKVPAYVEVDAVSVTTTPEQGASTSKITDAWISLDGTLIGVWELPARLPVLAEGEHSITVVPAIKRNGMFDDRLRYPFYTSWSGNASLFREGTATVTPSVTYIEQTEFWIEDSQDPFSRFTVTEDSDTTLLRFTPADNPEVVFVDNTPCSGFRLDSEHPRIRIHTDEDFEVYGGPIFLELDHRSDVVITVGVLYSYSGTSYAEPWVYITPTLKDNGSMPWSKIHIDLSTPFNTAIAERDIYIEASLPDGQSSGQVYFDNFKFLRING